jgi:hypothetical protein
MPGGQAVGTAELYHIPDRRAAGPSAREGPTPWGVWRQGQIPAGG